MKKKTGSEDDGRVIADMTFGGTNLERAAQTGHPEVKENPVKLDRKQTMSAIWGALLAGLLIGLVFVVAFLLFLLFATNVWLK